MLKDITLGQYYPADSPVHRLDPRVKLLATVLYLVSLFLVRNAAGLILVTACLVAVIALSGIPPKMMLRGVRAIWVLIVLTAVCNLLFAQGNDVLLAWGWFRMTGTGVRNAVYFTARLIYLVVGTSVMTLTTTPGRLTEGIEEAGKPLARIGVPVHELAMMMSIALRFIPILGEEAEKIKKAQLARGADFEEGGLLKRARGLMPVLIPLFLSAFRRANDLAAAMEARCYRGSAGRTRWKPLRFGALDYAALAVTGAYFAAVIFLRLALRTSF